MGALAHYLESEGLPTTQISLIRLHTEKIQPPRALWVPFELGRPLGAPNAPEFQTRVLMAALRLLDASAGPVIEDFDQDPPEGGRDATAWACPLPLPQSQEGDRLTEAFLAEIDQLSTWYNLALRERGRTTVGTSRMEPRGIGAFLAGFLEGDPPGNPRPEMALPWLIKLATEDLKAYYQEAVTAQPGRCFPTGAELDDWFWDQTVAGRVYTALSRLFSKSEDFETKILGKVLIVPSARAASRK
ncbi:MAG: hypothetical protein KKB20_22085 [Proteobacteria bacterium]|nr:hypothetical protein [Pseudomonadota bacterium]